MPALSGRECGLRGRLAHKRRGNLRFPLLLRITTPSYRARCARKDKCRFPTAARLFGQGKQNRCHPKGAGARCAPLREGNRNAPVVWNLPFLLLGVSGRQVERGTCFCARSAPLFAAANAANLRVETYTSAPAQRKRGDSQEGRNFVSPLLCACGAQPRICRYDLAYTARRVVNRASLARRVVAPYEIPRQFTFSRPTERCCKRHRILGRAMRAPTTKRIYNHAPTAHSRAPARKARAPTPYQSCQNC